MAETELTDAQVDEILAAADPAYLSARRDYKPAWRRRMRAALAAYEGGRAQRKSSSKAPHPEELAKRLARNAAHPQSDLNLAAATIRDLQARLEQAEREKAALFDHKEAENQLLERQASDLRALLRVAWEAVKPFALDDPAWTGPDDLCIEMNAVDHVPQPTVCLGDVRRARAFLDKLKENADAR